jgi:hypothetical protein
VKWAAAAFLTAALGLACGRAPTRPAPPVAAAPGTADEPAPVALDTAALVDRVRKGPCGPDGAGYGRWLEGELVRAGGALMYADWAVRRGGAGTNEVWFTYSLLDPTYRVLVGAYVWSVAPEDGDIHEPRRIEPRVRTGD